MQHPSFKYYVSRPDESHASGSPTSPYVPTIGHIASSIDIYRTIGIAEISDRPESWCFTDTDAAGALGRLIDGPIESRSDIEKAESALRAILLHDFVDVVVPCVKANNGSGFLGYTRFDKGQRNAASFAGLNVAPCRDLLMASEFIDVRQGEITASTNPNSKLIGASIEDYTANYHHLVTECAEVANAFPMDVDGATYFAMSEFQSALKKGPASFIDELYNRIEKPWTSIAQSGPILFVDLKLPPLVSIVLSRAQSREAIPSVLAALREELANVRSDLNYLNQMLGSSMTQADLQALIKRINASFDAIVPEALLTKAERRSRRIMSVFDFFKPLVQLYSIAVDPLSADPDKLMELIESIRGAMLNNQRIVSRSVSAAKFAELLRVDSIRDIVTSHFTNEEILLFKK